MPVPVANLARDFRGPMPVRWDAPARDFGSQRSLVLVPARELCGRCPSRAVLRAILRSSPRSRPTASRALAPATHLGPIEYAGAHELHADSSILLRTGRASSI